MATGRQVRLEAAAAGAKLTPAERFRAIAPAVIVSKHNRTLWLHSYDDVKARVYDLGASQSNFNHLLRIQEGNGVAEEVFGDRRFDDIAWLADGAGRIVNIFGKTADWYEKMRSAEGGLTVSWEVFRKRLKAFRDGKPAAPFKDGWRFIAPPPNAHALIDPEQSCGQFAPPPVAAESARADRAEQCVLAERERAEHAEERALADRARAERAECERALAEQSLSRAAEAEATLARKEAQAKAEQLAALAREEAAEILRVARDAAED